MNLSAFIKSHEDEIIDEWEAFARTCLPAAHGMSIAMLRDHIRGLLHFIANDIQTPQTERERSRKSKGKGPKAEAGAAERHGESRLISGFDLIQVHAEFRALRASVLRLWSAEWTKSNRDWVSPADVLPDLMRFNESIDQLVSESLARYLEGRGLATGERKPVPTLSPHNYINN